MKISIIDYGMGNLRSVVRAWEHIGADAFLVSDPSQIANADALIFPGQGAIVDTMRLLQSTGFDNMIRDWIAADKPFFGICLGLQALFEYSEEGDIDTLDIFKGSVKRFRFDFSDPSLKIPHMGWNSIKVLNKNLKINPKETDYYFVHSYYFNCKNKENILAETNYGIDFPSIVNKENIYGLQFHPEKSSDQGLDIIKSFIKL